MIVIKIEMHSADSGRVWSLGQAIIDNRGRSKTDTKGKRFKYRFRIARKGRGIASMLSGTSKPVREAHVDNWPRDTQTIWQLLRRCLNDAYDGPVETVD